MSIENWIWVTSVLFGALSGCSDAGGGALDLATIPDLGARLDLASTGSLTVLAGQIGSSGSADGTGVAAQFNAPAGIVSDGAGNLYVVDSGNGTVRKIVIATGDVTTLAGMPGLSAGADGIGTAASFDQPWGIASDGAGNLYVADTSNDTIRKVVIATRAVTTLAGTAGSDGTADGTGADARFSWPTGIASDGAGNLWVVDELNDTIRKVVIATGVVTTAAGTAGVPGSADGIGAAVRFYDVIGICSDGGGNLYISDARNDMIRKMVITTGAVTTMAGAAQIAGSTDGAGAAARFSYPKGVASDGAGNIYVADSKNNTIRKIVIGTGAVSTPVGVVGQPGLQPGPLPASLHCPAFVAAVSGGLAITDACENVVLIARFP
jgi:sugar lactone lactonase YvrE